MLLCVDREDIIAQYNELFRSLSRGENSVMYLYGIPGIGKSVLIEYLYFIIKDKFPDTLNVLINFNPEGNYFSIFNNAYRSLRRQGVRFFYYELALDYLYKLTGDKKYQLEHKHSSLFSGLAGLSLEFIAEPLYKAIAGGGLAMLKAASAGLSRRYRDYLLSKCKALNETKHEDIITELGKYFIIDINRYCEENNVSICYFVDSFEKCYEKTGFYENEFIERFMLSSENALWLTGGTAENPFGKYKTCFDRFSSARIDKLADKRYVREMLENRIADGAVIDAVFDMSKGYPASVELIAETYIRLSDLSDSFALTDLMKEAQQTDFYYRFFRRYYSRHIIAEDLNILAFLACFDSWTYKEVEYFVSLENTGSPKIRFEKLKKYVIVKSNPDGSFSVIDVARECLLNADRDITQYICKCAYEYLVADIKRISEESINEKNSGGIHLRLIPAIKTGAGILKSSPCFAEEFYNWFIEFEQSLSAKLLYDLKTEAIACFVGELKVFFDKNFKDDIHSDCLLQCLYDYAWTFCYQRNYARALEIINEYEEFAGRFIRDITDERLVKAQYTRAVIIGNLGEYDEALRLHKEILGIRRKSRDERGIGISLNSIGFLYMLMNDFTNAQRYFRESLVFRSMENDLGGFCTVNANLSKMYFLKSVYTGEERYLDNAVLSLESALAHLSEKSTPALFMSWKIRFAIIRAQKLRFSPDTAAQSYNEVLAELTDFYDAVIQNPRFGMQNHLLTTQNNMAVILALMGTVGADELMASCLSEKEVFYDIKSNPKNKPCSITRHNLEAIKENRLNDLIFEY